MSNATPVCHNRVGHIPNVTVSTPARVDELWRALVRHSRDTVPGHGHNHSSLSRFFADVRKSNN